MVQTITPQQANELISLGAIEVIDVREVHEWLAGHIRTSRLVPLARFRTNPRAEIGDAPILFVCAAGVRSETAARVAVANGAKRVYNLAGGTRAWARAGFTLQVESTAAAECA